MAGRKELDIKLLGYFLMLLSFVTCNKSILVPPATKQRIRPPEILCRAFSSSCEKISMLCLGYLYILPKSKLLHTEC